MGGLIIKNPKLVFEKRKMALLEPPSVGILSELRATRSARKNANAPRGGQGFLKGKWDENMNER